MPPLRELISTLLPTVLIDIFDPAVILTLPFKELSESTTSKLSDIVLKVIVLVSFVITLFSSGVLFFNFFYSHSLNIDDTTPLSPTITTLPFPILYAAAAATEVQLEFV